MTAEERAQHTLLIIQQTARTSDQLATIAAQIHAAERDAYERAAREKDKQIAELTRELDNARRTVRAITTTESSQKRAEALAEELVSDPDSNVYVVIVPVVAKTIAEAERAARREALEEAACICSDGIWPQSSIVDMGRLECAQKIRALIKKEGE